MTELLLPSAGAVLPRVDDIIAIHRPDLPVHCVRPGTLRRAAEHFIAAFPGETLYAVKCNPDPLVLRALHDGGVRHFDCASIAEVRVVTTLFPGAAIHFMHPVKSRAAIAEAYATHGVRDFVFDSAGELAKIVEETAGARDLGLILRIALPRGTAFCDLSGKFGALPDAAPDLLRAARGVAARVGISFHVGSQCADPLAWRQAIRMALSVAREAGVVLDILDVGGGFPAAYPGMEVPELGAFMAEIEAAVDELGADRIPELWAEPGRALVADGVSVVVQVQGRRDGALYINDGVYGSLSDAGAPGFRYPVRLLRHSDDERVPFSFFGPTCDSADVMKGPFLLPADTQEGDYIEIGTLGAYGSALQTGFNGFAPGLQIAVRDAPLSAAG